MMSPMSLIMQSNTTPFTMYASRWSITTYCLIILTLAFPGWVAAATMSVVPDTAVHTVGDTFTATVRVNTGSESINAAEGVLRYDPAVLSVTTVTRTNSIFNLWVTEPTVDRSAGTISFSGGAPSGYDGAVGELIRVTFRAASAGTGRVSFLEGSVLANDGRGSNVLTNMSGTSFTVQPVRSSPEPEVIEYIPTANTPAAPKIESETHPDPSGWTDATSARLSWTLPSDVVAVRTLLDERPSAVPTKLYETPISEITLEDLPDGESYFHLQFRNGDGWGQVAHYRLAVDTTLPAAFSPRLRADADLSAPAQTVILNATDTPSGVAAYRVSINDEEPFMHTLERGTGTLQLPPLDPGRHRVVFDAIDRAGNERTADLTFTLTAFERPAFTDHPTQLNEGVVPVIEGVTRPSSTVTVFVHRIGSEPVSYETRSDQEGTFTFIPDRGFSEGVYELTAQATDPSGAQSEVSHPIRISVQPPGFVRIGSLLVSVLSVVVPTIALLLLALIGVYLLVAYLRRFRRRVSRESHEALEILHREFTGLFATLRGQAAELEKSRRTGRLTKAEEETIATLEAALRDAQTRVEKEITDVEDLTAPTRERTDAGA